MDAYALHLAMAALVGASFMAVSAYYMHRKTLTEILDFARSIDRDRDSRGDSDDEAVSPAHSKKAAGEKERSQRRSGGHHHQHGRRKGAGYYRRGGSVSMPDVTAIAEAGDGGEEERVRQMNGAVGMSIPAGLSRLHTVAEGTSRYSDFSLE